MLQVAAPPLRPPALVPPSQPGVLRAPVPAVGPDPLGQDPDAVWTKLRAMLEGCRLLRAPLARLPQGANRRRCSMILPDHHDMESSAGNSIPWRAAQVAGNLPPKRPVSKWKFSGHDASIGGEFDRLARRLPSDWAGGGQLMGRRSPSRAGSIAHARCGESAAQTGFRPAGAMRCSPGTAFG